MRGNCDIAPLLTENKTRRFRDLDWKNAHTHEYTQTEGVQCIKNNGTVGEPQHREACGTVLMSLMKQ